MQESINPLAISLPSWDKVRFSGEMKCGHMTDIASPVGWRIEKFSCLFISPWGRGFALVGICMHVSRLVP